MMCRSSILLCSSATMLSVYTVISAQATSRYTGIAQIAFLSMFKLMVNKQRILHMYWDTGTIRCWLVLFWVWNCRHLKTIPHEVQQFLTGYVFGKVFE